MSRLRHLHIPFVQGADESVDAKVLPDGVFASLVNGRLDRAGDLRLRRGWRPLDMSAVGDDGVQFGSYNVVDLYSAGGSLVALVDADTSGLQTQTFVEHSSTVPWVRRRGVQVPPVTRVRAVGNVPDAATTVTRASTALTSDGVFGATLVQTTTKTVLRVFRVATDETIFYDDFAAAGDANERKIVSMGDSFGLVRNTGSTLQLQEYDPTAVTGLGSNTTLVTATVTQFDVAVAAETTPTALHLVYVVAGAVSYGQFTFAGVQVGSTKTVVASGALAAQVASDDVTAHVVYQASGGSGALSLLSFAATGAYTTSAGPTSVASATDYTDQRFAVGYQTTGTDRVWIAGCVCTGVTSTSAVDLVEIQASAHTQLSLVTHDSCVLVGGWIVRGAYAGVGLLRGNTPTPTDTFIGDSQGPWLVALYNLGRAVGAFAPWFPGQAPTGDVLAVLPRTSDATATTSLAAGQVATTQTTVRAFRLNDVAARRPGAFFGGALYLTGGVLTQVLHGGLAENGFMRPVLRQTSGSNGAGTLGLGTYEHRAIVVWTDEGGRLHRSPVSNTTSVTLAGAEDTATSIVNVAKTLRRDVNLVTNPVVELYRTEAGPGELFYHVATVAVSATDDETTITDTLPDATIIDNKRLYTEGEFGATSGALAITPPNPSGFAAVLRDRMVVAAAGGSDYQISQVVFPEEPVAFTQPGISGAAALVYQDSVEGAITGLATLDDTIVLGTRTELFVADATGGPNIAGVGEFPSPARLPSNVGFGATGDAAAASLVEDAAGLWFLADDDKLYVLPRGQATPVWAGQPVQQRLAAGAVVGAGREIEDDLTVWGLANATAVWRTGAQNAWGRDALPFTPIRFISHLGRLYAVDSSGDVWAQETSSFGDGASGATAVALQFETGDVNAFGLAGQGRLAVLEFLGEFRDAATLATEISYDSGATYATAVTHTISGLSAGATFQRQVDFARQRGGKFRLRVTMTPSSSTGEGCRLTGMSLYYALAGGATRLDSAKRK